MAKWPYNTTRWRKLRAAKLARVPLCEHCERMGFLVPATVVDHVQAIRAGGAAFPALDGLASLCAGCHSRKTAAIDRSGGAGYVKGAGLDGAPLDPAHPFFAGPGGRGGG